MRLIASSTTDHGLSTIKIDELLDREDCIYSIGQLSHRMISGVCILEDLTVEQAQIYDMTQTIANNS